LSLKDYDIVLSSAKSY